MTSFFDRLPLALTDTSISTYELWNVLMSLFIPAVCALAVFVFLRRAAPRRKLAAFFISLPVFLVPSLFLFSGPGGAFSPILGDTSDLFQRSAGFVAVTALGTVVAGVNVIVCSSGVMKLAGRTAAAVLSVLFTFAQTALLFLTVGAPAGGRVAVSDLIPPLGKLKGAASYFGKCSPDVFALLLLIVYFISLFLCFIANKSGARLKEEDIEEQHRLERLAAERLVSPDAHRCELCAHAVELKTEPGKLLCDFSGAVDFSGICGKFEYDPLKRPVGRPSSGEETEAAEEPSGERGEE